MSDKKRPFFKPGYYPDLSNEEYHSSYGYGSTTVKILAEKTKQHLDYQRNNPKPMTDALLRGQLLHCMVLEPEKVDKEFAIKPEVGRRSAADKKIHAEFEILNADKLHVSKEQYNTCLYMKKSIIEHPIMGTWFDKSMPGLAEQSIYYWYKSEDWDEKNDYKTMCKVRPDWVLEGHDVLFDIKTSKDAAYSAFMKQAKKLKYHMSAAMYLDGCNRNQEFLDRVGVYAFTKFVWVVVENEPPYSATYYEIGPEDLNEGKTLYHRLVRKLDLYNRSDWKGYGDQDENGLITPKGRISEFPSWKNDIV